MRIAPVADVKARFSRFLEECHDGPVVVTKNGRAVAALVCIEDDDELEALLLAHNPKLRRLWAEAEQRMQEPDRRIPHDEFWAEVETEARDSDPAAP